MRIDVLNGFSRVNIAPELQGFSRVNLQGFSRVNLQGMYNLNGFTLNGYELNEYQNYCELNGMNPRNMNSLAAFLAAAGKKGIQLGKKIRDRRIAAGKKPIFHNLVDRLQQKADEEAGIQDFENENDFVIEQDFEADQRLFGPPSLFKDPGKWFGSDKVPVVQKIGVVAGGVVLIDALTGGNIILKRVGIMKKGKK
jgi:hypothetical protein